MLKRFRASGLSFNSSIVPGIGEESVFAFLIFFLISSSLDGFGTEEFLKIIRYVIKDANIFVISHKSDLHDKFDNIIKFDKIKGFSGIVK